MTDDNYTFTNCDEWISCLKTNDGIHNQNSICCFLLCFPIKFPINLFFCGPCLIFNIIYNKCKNTKDKNYLF
jgi:hypothetical protein